MQETARADEVEDKEDALACANPRTSTSGFERASVHAEERAGEEDGKETASGRTNERASERAGKALVEHRRA